MINDPITEALKINFDRESRCQVYGDVAIRYLGLPKDILVEVRECDFAIINRQIFLHESDDDQDMLLVDAHKPG